MHDSLVKLALLEGDRPVYPGHEGETSLDQERKYNRFQTSTVLPYMGPDTNAEEFIPMYEQFLYNPNAQKPVSENIGDAYEFML